MGHFPWRTVSHNQRVTQKFGDQYPIMTRSSWGSVKIISPEFFWFQMCEGKKLLTISKPGFCGRFNLFIRQLGYPNWNSPPFPTHLSSPSIQPIYPKIPGISSIGSSCRARAPWQRGVGHSGRSKGCHSSGRSRSADLHGAASWRRNPLFGSRAENQKLTWRSLMTSPWWWNSYNMFFKDPARIYGIYESTKVFTDFLQ